MEFKSKTWFKWLWAALLILIIPNIFFWVIEPKVQQVRGIFVVEYFFIACLYPLIKRKLFIAIWILFAIFDLVFSICSLFFMDVFELAHALTKIPSVTFGGVLKWVCIVVLVVLVMYGLLSILMRYHKSFPFLRFRFMWPFMVTGLIIIFANIHRHQWYITAYHSKKDIVSAPVTSVINTIGMVIAKVGAKKEIDYYGSAAKKVFSDSLTGTAASKEILILVESWGLITNKKLQNEIIQPLLSLAQNHQYVVNEGVNQYKYLTQAGEFRELTGYIFHYYQVHDNWVKENSILIKKQQQGYHVIGVHGYSSQFYRRDMIWPVLGVQETYFDEDFAKLSMPLCGDNSFRGVCDTAIDAWLFNRISLQPQRKEFYYWVTLNTHLPLGEVNDEGYQQFAEKWSKEGIAGNVLKLGWKHRVFFTHVAAQLARLQAPNLHMLLVGDHAPPFIDPAERSMYDEKYVPYIEIFPATR